LPLLSDKGERLISNSPYRSSNPPASIDEFSLVELLEDYSRDCPDRMRSLHNYIAFTKYAAKIRPSDFLMDASIGIHDVLLRELFPKPESEFDCRPYRCRPDGSFSERWQIIVRGVPSLESLNKLGSNFLKEEHQPGICSGKLVSIHHRRRPKP